MSNATDFSVTLAHHDAAIQHLGGRITGVENSLRTLQGEVHTGFTSIQTAMGQQIGGLASKLDKLDAAPKFDVGRTLNMVKDVAILFAMTCAGIIYIAGGQYSITAAKQDALNAQRTQQIEQINERLRELESWRPVVTKKD